MSSKLQTLSLFHRPSSFRSHLIVALIITMVPLFIFSIVMIYLLVQNDRAVFQRGANQRTRALLTAVDIELKSSITKLEALATSRHLEDDDLHGFRDDAARILKSQSDWFTINLSTPAGQEVMNLLRPPGAALPMTADRQSQEEVLRTGRPAVGGILRGPLTNKYEFSVRVPTKQNGVIKYLLSAVISSDSMAALFTTQRLPPDWIGVVLDGNGRIVTRTLNPERTLGQPASRSFAAALDSVSEGWFEGKTIEGSDVYTSFNRSPFSAWTVAIAIPTSVVEASFYRSLFYVASFGIMFLAFGVALAWFLSMRTARSIKSLTRLAAHLASGKQAQADDVPYPIAEVEQVKQSLIHAGRLIHERSQERDKVELALRQVTERLELAQVAGHIGTFERDLITDEIKWSASQEELYGFSPGSFGGRPEDWAKHVHPEDISVIEATVLRAKETIGSINVEFRVIHPDGAVRWIASQAKVFADGKGTPRRMVGVNLDITERKKAEQALRTATEQLQIITAAMAAPVTRCSRDLTYSWVSRPYAEWLGCSPDEIIGRPIIDVIGREAFNRLRPYFERVLAGEVIRYEERVDFQRIGPRWVNAVYTPTFDSRGSADGWVAVVMDIDERKKAEESLRETDRRKDEFLAMLGHELRNPLGVISNIVQLMRKKKAENNSALDDFEEIMVRQIGQMARLLDDLLDISRIGHGQIRLKEEPCDLTEIVHKAVEDHRRLLEGNGLRLPTELPPTPLWIMGDRTRLAQIVGNALQNANKFTDRGGTVAVVLRKMPHSEEAVITVRDTGIGMEPAMVAHAFEPFSQAEQSVDRSRGGLGLGLALVKGLVELHRGKVAIASEGAGRGVELTMRFPLIEAPAQAAQPAEPAHNGARACRILIIEDNILAAKSTAMFLAASGHAVEVAHDGHSGIEAAWRFRPEVVLCDIGLPGLDGYAVCRALRQEPGLKEVFLIAVTGYGQQDDQVSAREAGFDFHLTKPIDLSELERLLAGLNMAAPGSIQGPAQRNVASA